ncbi:hypothetical protein [Nocardia aurantia]|uniref:YbaB/EbfC family DNA-binding protein n=1 Tax=Nocardia aurantia TaxID=2585199 RepID=A0A7K0E0E7_9NOCA|nr:hypothetical protein [Nocardia aurantia]MQY31550.1 hypothetical protein [Nocardia aurantia]
MSAPQSGSPGFGESLDARMEQLADALNNGHAARRADGVYVDVFADGRVRTVVIDAEMFPGSGHLGAIITELINRAREDAQAAAADLVRDIRADPRIAEVVEKLGDAPERPLRPMTAQEKWEYDNDPHHRHSG